MNAMSLRSTASRGRAAVLALAALLATTSVIAAEGEKRDAQSQAETERKLEDARRRLDAAAREVAELSMSMSEHAVPSIRLTRIPGSRAMVGINIGARGEQPKEGVRITSVSPGGAAESAGLKAGDVLLAINDKPLEHSGDLSPREVLLQAMGEVKPGEKVQLRYRRDDKVATATVTAESATDRIWMHPFAAAGRTGHVVPAMPFPPPLAMMRAVGVFGSAELVPLTPKLGRYFGTDKGLLVVRAPADSRLKLEDGDVIVDIDGRTPSSPTHAFRILGSYQAGEQLKLSVLRMKKRMTFEVTIPEDPASSAGLPFSFGLHHRGRALPAPEIGVRGHDEIIWSPAMPLPPPPPGEPGVTDTITYTYPEDEPA